MTLEEQTFDAIHARLLADVDDSLDKRQGSVVYDLTAPTAAEAELMYAFLAILLDRAFADTAEGEDLDKRVLEQGLVRKAAVNAVGTVVVTGTDGFVVASGTILRTVTGIEFTTDADGAISGGTVTIPITAVVGGASGNVGAGGITLIDGNLTGITGVTNTEATTGGIDEEDDQSLFDRYIEKVSLPATSGNAYHYIQTAKEIAGVQDVRVFPLWNGPGTVRVVLASTDGLPVTTELSDEVAAHIEEIRPIGADVTVAPASVISVTVNATVQFDPLYLVSDVRAEIIANVTAYIAGLGLMAEAVRYSQVMKAVVSVEGVTDCSALTINAVSGDVVLAEDATPVISGVVVSGTV